ncbi:hypothetical protein PYCC9005_005244 [Savitreella phatthalungensis]
MNSDQVNYLVWRYLSESGFDHAAWSLKVEMRNAEQLDRIWANRVPTGHLIHSLQKSLLFDECLQQVDESGRLKEESELEGLAPALIPVAPIVAQPKPQQSSSKKPSGENGYANGDIDTASKDVDMTDSITIQGPRRIPKSSIVTLQGHAEAVVGAQWHPSEGNCLATCSADGTARVWDLASGKSAVLNCLPCKTPDKTVTAVCFNPDGSMVATGSFDGAIRLFNKTTGALQSRPITSSTGPILSLKWGRTPETCLAAGADGLVLAIDTRSAVVKQKWQHKMAVVEVEWISDALFVCATVSGSLKLVQVSGAADAHVREFAGHKEPINSIRWHNKMNLFATASDDSTVKVWRADREAAIKTLQHHVAPVQQIEWAPPTAIPSDPDGRVLVSADRAGVVCIWDAGRASLLHVLKHERPVPCVAFALGTGLLVCAGQDGKTTFWRADDGKQQLEAFIDHDVQFVAFSPVTEPGKAASALVLATSNPDVLVLPALALEAQSGLE